LKREDIIKAHQRGSFLDHYEKGEMLGEGAFGTVNRCRHRSYNAEFAVKVISKNSIKHYETFINEVKMLMELDHPQIIRLIEYFEEETQVNLVFELCTGMDMFDKIVQVAEEKGHFSALETAFAMRQMIKAVIGCHSHHIIHNDIKPENFMIKDAKKEKLAGFMHVAIRLIDLGISEHFVDGEKKKTAQCGSVSYVAPEVIQGSYDEKCDVWSLGVIMYMMIVGDPLFSLTDPVDVVRQSVTSREFVPNALRQITKSTHPWIMDDAKDLMSKMLVYDPSQRISLEDAVKHPFIQQSICHQKELDAAHIMSGTAFDVDMSKKLERFARMPALRRAALVIMSHMASDESTVLQRRTFRRIDVNFDGQLSKQELEDWFESSKSQGVQLPAMWDMVFKQIDVGQRGRVQYCEFLAGTLPSSIFVQPQMLEQAFMLLDMGHDGKVDDEDLLTLVQNRVPRQVIHKIIAEALEGNSNSENTFEGKSYLTYDDFKLMMCQEDYYAI